MPAGLRALLAGILDYAGLFPPARLPLDQAVFNYARYRDEPDAWLLRNFICPAARLGELNSFESIRTARSPWTLSALGRGGETAEEFLDGLRADLNAVRGLSRTGLPAVVNTLELRVLPEMVPEVVGLVDGFPEVALYLEPPTRERETISDLVSALHRINVRRCAASRAAVAPVGVKLRCGGPDASAVPNPEEVAHAIAVCRDAGVPLKFTAGLHHPVRRHDPGLGTHTHGFLNVFTAGVMAQALRLSENEIRAVLEAENTADLTFDDAGLSWRGRYVPAAAIALARQRAVTSFGSCSFDEPRDDLRALGLL